MSLAAQFIFAVVVASVAATQDTTFVFFVSDDKLKKPVQVKRVIIQTKSGRVTLFAESLNGKSQVVVPLKSLADQIANKEDLLVLIDPQDDAKHVQTRRELPAADFAKGKLTISVKPID